MTTPRLVVLAALLAAACAPAAGTPDSRATAGEPAADPGNLVAVELATVGMDVAAQAPVVLLREAGSGKVMPIWVGVPEAQAILRGLLGIETPRPMTHDLLAEVVKAFGGELEEVVVHELRESTYIARLELRLNGRALTVDARPSDALALALRTDAGIRVAGPLLADPPEIDFLPPEAGEQVVRILGTTVVAPTPALRERFGLPDRPGLVVVGTFGEAAERGLRRGDYILEINGIVPGQPMDFMDAVLSSADAVVLRYWREGAEGTVELTPVDPYPTERPRRRAPIQT